MSRGGSKPGERRGGRCKDTPNKRTLLAADKLEVRGRDAIEGVQSLSFAPEQLRQELGAGGDLPDLLSGALTAKTLELAARTLALMRYPYAPELRVRGTALHRVRVVSENKNEG